MQSIFDQDYIGSVQILIGIDAVEGDRGAIAELRNECPLRMKVDVLDIPFATSRQRGGVYTNREGGALPVLLAFAANARHIVFLDDDNWVARDHLSALRSAVEGFDWAFTLRWLADGAAGRVLCVDEWESVGPGRGVFAAKAGGFVDPNCMIIDKLACTFCLPWFAFAMFENGTCSDRNLFKCLARRHSVGWTGHPTVYYGVRPDDPMNGLRASWLAARDIAPPGNWQGSAPTPASQPSSADSGPT